MFIVVEKTNAMRMLEGRKIPFETYTFDPDIHSADGVAEALGLPTHQVYKTLVVMRQRGKPLLLLAAGDRELDLKRLAHAVGEKKLRMASYKEAESLTGLQVGGISALALINRGFDVYIDRAATELSHILVSAGCRGINLMLSVEDLMRITKARVIEATAKVDE
jgi:Cys-tRNA(Pro)/Cys-tRNA(Cys) deacylase